MDTCSREYLWYKGNTNIPWRNEQGKKIMSGFVKAGFSFLRNIGKGKTSPTIKSLKPNVPKTKLEKAKSKLAIAKQKSKGSKAALNQTIFNFQKERGQKIDLPYFKKGDK